MLDADALVADATATTGLEDFGPPVWREGLDVLVDALHRDAGLNAVGEATFTHRLGGYLQRRLEVVDWWATHPDLAGEVIHRPLVICGLPRTGTTALSNLLAADPDTRSLRVWESAAPVPPPRAATERDDPRIAATQAGIDLMHRYVPEMRLLHDDTATSTAEGIDLLGMSFRTTHFNGMAVIPSYDAWWLDCDMRPAFAFHRQVLQLLQSECPPSRWHLKNPGDVFCLGALRAVYPDAVLVWTHRDPARVLPSVSNLIATITRMNTDGLDLCRLGDHLLELWATGIDRAMAYRDANPEGFIDVHMRDLVADPLGTAARVYDDAGWAWTDRSEAGLAAYWRDHPPGRHGRHEPDPAEYGLAPERVRERFAAYIERFGVLERPAATEVE
jgi:hypothetical protein